ncbi:MAG: hypothetical protein FWD39_04465 [Clostridiales bacterium]|nr:hypothetical protein [Clostridiales bacterium]
MRDKTGVLDYGFVAALDGDNLTNITKVSQDRYGYIRGIKRLEIKGFTQKAKEWSGLRYNGYDLEKLEHIKLSDLLNKEQTK